MEFKVDQEPASAVFFRIGPTTPGPLRVLAPGETVSTQVVHLGHLHSNLDRCVQASHKHLRQSVPQPYRDGRDLLIGAGRIVDREVESMKREIDMAAERALLELHRTKGSIVRFAFVYGEGDPHLREGMRWFAEWHPDKTIQLLHHADAAQAVMLAADKAGIGGQLYNAADDAPVSAAEAIGVLGEKLADDAYDRPLLHPMEAIADSGKIRRELGFAPLYPTLFAAAAAGAL